MRTRRVTKERNITHGFDMADMYLSVLDLYQMMIFVGLGLYQTALPMTRARKFGLYDAHD